MLPVGRATTVQNWSLGAPEQKERVRGDPSALPLLSVPGTRGSHLAPVGQWGPLPPPVRKRMESYSGAAAVCGLRARAAPVLSGLPAGGSGALRGTGPEKAPHPAGTTGVWGQAGAAARRRQRPEGTAGRKGP